MADCRIDRTELTGLLAAGRAPERETELLAHVESCDECARELRTLRETWKSLPDLREAAPPAALRRMVLAHARGAVAAPRTLVSEIRQGVRPFATPVLLGAAGTALVVAALGLRGLLAVEGAAVAAGLSLALGALLALAAGVARRTPVRTVRSLLVATLVAFGGYVALVLAVPIPETVEFCRVRLLPAPEVSMASLCLLYVGVAVLYAGLPAGVAGYLWADREWRWSTALAGALLLVVLAAPVLGLHFGLQNAILGASVLAGVALGALSGGAAGGWLRRRTLRRALA